MRARQSHKRTNSPARIACVIIAAGRSSRLGQPKQLLSKQGKSLLENVIEQATGLCSDIRVVLGYEAQKMVANLNLDDLKMIYNDNWPLGMGTSIAVGVEDLGKDIDACLILLCDQWAITIDDLRRLIERSQFQPDKIVASQYYDGKRKTVVLGAPAIFPCSKFAQLRQLRETGARHILNTHAKEVVAVEMPGAAFDLDTAEDLVQFRQAYPV